MISWEADVFSEHAIADRKTSPSAKGVACPLAYLYQIDPYVRTLYNVIEQIE